MTETKNNIKCKWSIDKGIGGVLLITFYKTECEERYIDISRAFANKFNYCPFCGSKIKLQEANKEGKE
jgi:hypothetical protein